jgi:hypothetical protein
MSSERIADEIAGVFIGLLLATLAAALMNWLWPEMRAAVFIAFLLYWVFNTIDSIKAERAGRIRTSRSGWRYVRPSDIKRANPRTCIWGDIALIVLGIVLGLFAGGVVGLLWQSGKWLAFFIAFSLWTATIAVGIREAWRQQ